jgi:predicted secreted protein
MAGAPFVKSLATGTLLTIVGSLSVMPARSAEAAPVTVTENQNGGTVELPKNQTLIVRLPAQLGTGFSWSVVGTEGAPVRLSSTRTEHRDVSMPGSAETQVFVFEPTTPGSAKIELGYRQPWIKDRPPARNFTLHVVIPDKGSR